MRIFGLGALHIWGVRTQIREGGREGGREASTGQGSTTHAPKKVSVPTSILTQGSRTTVSVQGFDVCPHPFRSVRVYPDARSSTDLHISWPAAELRQKLTL